MLAEVRCGSKAAVAALFADARFTPVNSTDQRNTF
jgi:hypothetical protein